MLLFTEQPVAPALATEYVSVPSPLVDAAEEGVTYDWLRSTEVFVGAHVTVCTGSGVHCA